MAKSSVSTESIQAGAKQVSAAADGLREMTDVVSTLSKLGSALPGGHLEHSGNAAGKLAQKQIQDLANRADSAGGALTAAVSAYGAMASAAAEAIGGITDGVKSIF